MYMTGTSGTVLYGTIATDQPRVKLDNAKIAFMKEGTIPQVTLGFDSTGTYEGSALEFKIPNSLPTDTNTNILKVNNDGQMNYTSVSINGDFNTSNDGAVGFQSDETLNTSITKIDNWLFNNLVDHPPAPENLDLINFSSTTISLMWDKPTQYHVGFIDNKIPHITGLQLKVFKSNSTLTTLSTDVTAVSGSTKLTGSGFNGISELSEGNVIIIPGDDWSTNPTLSQEANAGDNTIYTTGWSGSDGLGSGNITLFTFEGIPGEFKITEFTGTLENTSSILTLTLDKPLFTSIASGTALVNEEIKVITSVTDTEITLDSVLINSATEKTAKVREYDNSNYFQLETSSIEPSTLIDIDCIRFFIDDGRNGYDTPAEEKTYNGKTKNIYNINDSTNISNSEYIRFEIFYTNYNTNLTHNIARLSELTFVTPGTPVAPTNLQSDNPTENNFKITFTAPIDNDSNTAGNNSTPAIENYQISYSSDTMVSGVTRYNYSTDDSSAYNHTPSPVTSTTTRYGRSDIYLGQTYTVEVSAKNVINSNYGSSISTDIDYNITPTAPALLSSKSLLNPATTYEYDHVARKVGTADTVDYKIINQNEISGSLLSYTLLQDVGVNILANNQRSNALTENITFTTTFGTNDDIPIDDLTTGSFSAFKPGTGTTNPNPFTYGTVNGEFTTGNNTHIILSNQEDLYSYDDNNDKYKSGFWSQIDITPKVKKTSIPASVDYYKIGLQHAIGTSITSSIVDTFYVDDLGTTASIHKIEDITITDGTGTSESSFSISGVQSRNVNFTIGMNVSINNLGRYFIRSDKILSTELTYDSSIVSDSNTKYFSIPSGNLVNDFGDPISTPVPSHVHLSHTVKFSDRSSKTFTSPSKKLKLKATPFNLLGDGSEFTERGRIDTTNFHLLSDTTGKFIFIDTVSFDRYSSNSSNKLYGKNSTSDSDGYTIYPTRRIFINDNDNDPNQSSTSQTPVTYTNFIEYDDDEVIVGNTSSSHYNQELQFTNGLFQTPASSEAFLNYSNDYLTNTLSMHDYSTATSSSSDYRWANFIYTLGGNTNISKLDLRFHNTSSFSVNTNGTINHMLLYLKLINIQDDNYLSFNSGYSGSISNHNYASDNYTTMWLNANSIVNASVTASQSTWGDTSTLGNGIYTRAVLENSSSGNTKTSSSDDYNRRIILAPGTPTDDMHVIIRIGLRTDQNIKFSHITVHHD